MASLETVQKKLTDEIANYQSTQKEYQKNVGIRQQLDSQLNENKIVHEELDLLQDDAVIYKLTGPALIKHDLKEAKENVGNRIKYINDEIKKLDSILKDLEKKQEGQKEVISKIQQQVQSAQERGVKAAKPKSPKN